MPIEQVRTTLQTRIGRHLLGAHRFDAGDQRDHALTLVRGNALATLEFPSELLRERLQLEAAIDEQHDGEPSCQLRLVTIPWRRVDQTIDPERVHHGWDNTLEPILRVGSGDVVRYELRMAGHGQIREGDSYEQTQFDFATHLPPLGAGLGRGRRARRHAPDRHPRARAGRLGLGIDPARPGVAARRLPRAVGRDLRPSPAGHGRGRTGNPDPDQPLPGDDGHPPRQPRAGVGVPAAQGRRQHRHPPSDRGVDAVATGLVRRGAVLVRRSPRRAGRRGGVRDRDRVPDDAPASASRSSSGRSRGPVFGPPARCSRSTRARATSGRWASTRN